MMHGHHQGGTINPYFCASKAPRCFLTAVEARDRYIVIGRTFQLRGCFAEVPMSPSRNHHENVLNYRLLVSSN